MNNRPVLCCLLLVLSCCARAVDVGSIEGVRGCVTEFEAYRPQVQRSPHALILAHGFMRNLESLRGWGEHLSGLGFPVVLVSLCNSSWLNGRHQANATDLMAVGKHLGLDSIIYGGFSAGGLSAYLAALDDPAASGYIGLDPVDSGDLALDREDSLHLPALFVLARPSACNARGNFTGVIEGSYSYQVVNLPEATHCHFELPHDRRCDWLCGRSSEEQTQAAQERILGTVSDWLQQFRTAGVDRAPTDS
jgi:pimeloyl-ACP methyl ester carboxylesterase